MPATPPKIKMLALDFSNLSIEPDKLRRTGIQEVGFRILQALADTKKYFPGFEVINIPYFPLMKSQFHPTIDTPVPQLLPATLAEVAKTMDKSFEEVWGFPSEYAKTLYADNHERMRYISAADAICFLSVTDIAGIAANLTGMRRGRPQISAVVHDLIPLIYPEFFEPAHSEWFHDTYVSALRQVCDQLICNSCTTAVDCDQYLAARGALYALPLPLPRLSAALANRESLLKKYGLQKGKYFLAAGSIEPRKNLHLALEGFLLFSKFDNSDTTLVVAGGPGWLNSGITSALERHRKTGHVVCAGYVSDEDFFTLMQYSAGLIMLSHYEGFGLPLAQARALGTPRITYYGSSLMESAGDDAIFVNPTSPFSIAAGLRRALDQAGKNSARAEPDTSGWEGYVFELLRIISSNPNLACLQEPRENKD